MAVQARGGLAARGAAATRSAAGDVVRASAIGCRAGTGRPRATRRWCRRPRSRPRAARRRSAWPCSPCRSRPRHRSGPSRSAIALTASLLVELPSAGWISAAMLAIPSRRIWRASRRFCWAPRISSGTLEAPCLAQLLVRVQPRLVDRVLQPGRVRLAAAAAGEQAEQLRAGLVGLLDQRKDAVGVVLQRAVPRADLAAVDAEHDQDQEHQDCDRRDRPGGPGSTAGRRGDVDRSPHGRRRRGVARGVA